MKIILYTNILTPYRKYFYDLMYEECKAQEIDFEVLLMANTEPNRKWVYNDLQTEYTKLLKSYTFSKGETYIHLNLGLSSYLKANKPHIVICAGSYLCPGVWQVANMKKKIGYKVLYWSESHLNEFRSYSNIKIKFREWIRRKIYHKFDGYWYAGKLSREFIEKYAIKDSYYFFMPNLIDELKYYESSNYFLKIKEDIQKKYSLATNKLTFFCPARLSPVKGILEFINLLSKCEYHNKITVLIAGDGELYDEILKMSKAFNLDIRLLGFKTQEEIIELYSVSDVFLMPSLSDPNPLTCIEALWCGLPLLVTQHVGNYPEVIVEGINGFTIEYSNITESITKIDRLINSSKEWLLNASLTSLEVAKSNYCSKQKVEETIEFLIRLVNDEKI